MFLVVSRPSNAGDRVVIVPMGGDLSTRPTQVGGQIIDFTGQELTIRLPSGREQRIATESVREVIAERVEQETLGERLFEAGKYDEAIEAFEGALSIEARNWVRRRIQARLSLCYQNQSDFLRAARHFLELYRQDPTSQYVGAIPVLWHTPNHGELDVLARPRPLTGSSVQKLILASWQLTGTQRAESLDALKQVAATEDKRLAVIAEAQRWRTETATASAAEVRRWQERMRNWPPELQTGPYCQRGPYYVMGQALLRLDQPEQAALCFLRVPLETPQFRELSSESLRSAVKALRAAGQEREAASLLPP